MAKLGAQFGNTNAANGSQFRDALHQALVRYKNNSIKKKTVLSHIAKLLIDKALKGEMPAIKEIADRLDGKPTQAITGPSGEPITLVERVIVVQAIEPLADQGNVIEGEVVQDKQYLRTDDQ